MKDIRIKGKLYRWHYQERDGRHWYIPKNSRPSYNTKGYLLTDKQVENETLAT